MKYCFVILHYNVLQDTINCIESIKALEQGEHQVWIQVVDNHSSNGSGADLCGIYAGDSSVRVLLRDANDGFSKGNNAGVMEARAWCNPDIYIVVNNDVVFSQTDFLNRLTEIAAENEDVSIFGPDIFVPGTGQHQSPIGDSLPTGKQLRRTVFFNKIALLIFPLVKPLLRRYFEKMRSSTVQAQYKMARKDVVIMGACMMYRKDYVENRLEKAQYCGSETETAKPLFAPETDFYYEEYLQHLYCIRNNVHTLYTPELSVQHFDGGATKGAGNNLTPEENDEKRMRFVLKNTMNAARIMRKALD